MAIRLKILAFDTSTFACSVALLHSRDATNPVRMLHELAPRQQTKRLIPMMETLLKESSLSVADLDAIAFSCGPGSFTGLRIASSVAQAIGFGANLPVIPVSSLAAMALAAQLEEGWTRLLVAVDARMGEVYWAAYHVLEENRVEILSKEETARPDNVTIVDNLEWYGIGD